jgi:hypothetical protein
MNKRHLHHFLKLLRHIRAWYLVIAIVITAGVAVTELRSNSIKAVELRDRVLQVDKQNGNTEAALRDLREHVYTHMNSKLSVPGGAYPPVQLKYRYDRLVAAEKKRVTQINAKLYTEAQGYCEAMIPTGRSLSRIDCIQNYITTKGGAKEKAIPDSLYKFDFVPPVWSPDLAGWSLVLLVVLMMLLVVRTAALLWLKHTLHE